jgi:hypothetical protein
VGNIGFRNATGGTTTLAPATGELGTGTVTLPLSGTLATLGANTFTSAQIIATGSDVATNFTVRGADGNPRVQIGTLAHSTTYGAIYLGNLIPGSTNWAYIGNGSNSYFNASAAVRFSVNDVEQMLLNTNLLTLNSGLILKSNATTDATSGTTGSINTLGGIGVTKAAWIGTTLSVTGSTTLTGNLTSNGALITTPEALAPALDAGAAVGVTTLTSTIAVNGTNAVTLANGTNGQIKTIVCTAVTGAGTATLTPTTCTGYTTVAFTAAGQTLTLQYFTTGGWHILSVRGAVPA